MRVASWIQWLGVFKPRDEQSDWGFSWHWAWTDNATSKFCLRMENHDEQDRHRWVKSNCCHWTWSLDAWGKILGAASVALAGVAHAFNNDLPYASALWQSLVESLLRLKSSCQDIYIYIVENVVTLRVSNLSPCTPCTLVECQCCMPVGKSTCGIGVLSECGHLSWGNTCTYMVSAREGTSCQSQPLRRILDWSHWRLKIES